MRSFQFQNWQKPVGVVVTALMLAGLIVQPATAAENDKSWFTAKTKPVTERVCVGKDVSLKYTVRFDGISYCKDNKCLKSGPFSFDGPAIAITSHVNGIIKEYLKQLKWKEIDGETFWEIPVIFTPTKAGKTYVDLKANFMGVAASDTWQFNIMDPCPMDIEIHANQSNVKLSGKTLNEAQNVWDFRSWWEGYARIISDPIDQGSGSGGNQRPVISESFTTHKEDATGTLEFFHDAIYIGHLDFETCWVEGAHICSLEFTVHPVPSDETIDFQFDIASGQCSLPTVVCKDEHGLVTGSTTSTSKVVERKMNAVIPREGGSTHYIDEFPYGLTIDYLISAFPVEEE